MGSITQILFRDSEYIWRKILEHPFVKELFTGSLSLEKFKYYVMQDYNYLIAMMKTFSIIASKAEYEVAKLALEIAHQDATIEMENYKELLNELGLNQKDVIRREPAPTNISYTSYMISTALLEPPIYGLTVTLPCFWSYQYIAENYLKEIESINNQLYRKWALTYVSKEYKELVTSLREIIDKLYESKGADLEKMKQIFKTASRFEYMFWDMAYRMEKWPL